MLTLTLRSYADGRYLARIVEQDGEVFVLDHGDSQMIADAVQRIQRGFTVMRGGSVQRIAPRQEGMLVALADHYAGESLLVAFEEPLWSGRTGEESLSSLSEADPLSFLPSLEDDTQDVPTDVWSRDDAARVRELIGEARDRGIRETWRPDAEDKKMAAGKDLTQSRREETDEILNVPEWEGGRALPNAGGEVTEMFDDDGMTDLFPVFRAGLDEGREDQ